MKTLYPHLFFLLSLLLLISFGCGDSRTIAVVCAEEHYPILSREADFFTLLYANREVAVHPLTMENSPKDLEQIRNAHHTLYNPETPAGLDVEKAGAIRTLAEIRTFDLYLCDSAAERKKLDDARMVLREERIGSLSLVLLISESLAKEKDVTALASLWKNQLRLGILDAHYGGLGEVSTQVLARFPREQWQGLVIEWESCRELLLALEAEKVDAILIWESIARAATTWHAQRLAGKDAEKLAEKDETALALISLPPFPNDPIVVPLMMISLAESPEPQSGQLFIRFLRAPATVKRLAEAGWGRP